MKTLLHILFLATALATPLTGFAQNYPTKAIRIVVPFPPSGAADLLARTIGQKLTMVWGQSVVIDNRPGVGGNLGLEIAAKAPPDGYTAVMAAVTTNAIGMSTYAKLTYSLEKDLAPVTLVGNVPHILVAHPSLPAKNVKELIALAKAHPDEIAFASQGAGTLSHLEQEMLKMMGGFKALHVPYKGSAPGITDLMAGNVQLFFDSIPSSLPHIKSGRIRALGVASSKRSPALPEVPSIGESLKGFSADSWFGLMMPAGTPRDIINKFDAETQKVLASQEVKERLLAVGGFVQAGGPDVLGKRIKEDVAKWVKVARTAEIKID